MNSVLDDVSFCHLVVGVTDMDRALAFYRDVIGMEVVFETLISGGPFDAVLHATRKQEGRVVGGFLGGLMVELLSLGAKAAAEKPARRGITGLQNLSLSVTDLDETRAFVDITTGDLALGYDVGPRATFLLMQAVYPLMVEAGGGSIVNLGSGSGTGGEPKWGGDAAAKEAIRGLSKVAALEWGRDNIHVDGGIGCFR
jgi:NAD(P)-dependent dehydrogenase (short-subunit alcohol dehydrogenase family)